MKKVFWLLPGRLAGRSGPDQDPWNLDTLREAGFGAVLSVNDGIACRAEEFAARSMRYACIPFSCNAPPLSGDHRVCLAALPRAYDFVTQELGRGHAVLVHCTAGKDRTGMFLSYFLMREHGLTPHAAISAVREVRPIALSAAGWDNFAREVLAHFALHPTRRLA